MHLNIFIALLVLITNLLHNYFPYIIKINNIHSTSVLATKSSITLTPTITQEIIATPTKTYHFVSNQILIDCVGPDGKHLKVTQKICDDFNNAWSHPAQSNILPTSPWGQAVQIGEHTYTIKVGQDSRMATPSEVVDALNNYRNRKGVGSLSWDQKLGAFAQSRADSFAANGKLDQHAGFRDYLNNQDGFNKLGYAYLGENAAMTGPLLGVHLIEWVFAGDSEHDTNQLNSQWTNVGVGINGGAVDVIFGGQKK